MKVNDSNKSSKAKNLFLHISRTTDHFFSILVNLQTRDRNHKLYVRKHIPSVCDSEI